MSDVNAEALLKLIDILLASCTRDSDLEVGSTHNHSMFDNVGVERLESLREHILWRSK